MMGLTKGRLVPAKPIHLPGGWERQPAIYLPPPRVRRAWLCVLGRHELESNERLNYIGRMETVERCQRDYCDYQRTRHRIPATIIED